MSKNARTSRLAPPTSAPSTSGSWIELVDVVRLDAAAVDHVAVVAGVGAEPLAQPRADVGVRLARLLRRGVAAGADRPHRLVGQHQRRHLVPGEPVQAGLDLPVEHGSVSSFSRSSSVSPMHTIGVRSAASAATSLRFTVASVSPNSRRRSEWPMITYSAPASLSIAPLISPVNAPSRSQ